MPVMDGYTLARTIRAEEARAGAARIPIVALTASALKGEAERCQEAGMDDYLAKPVGVAMLAATLQRWLPHTVRADASSGPDATTAAPAADPAMILDPAVLAAAVGSDPATVRMVLDDFFASVVEDAAAVAAAIVARDLPALTRHAHRIKGAARLVGAVTMAEVASALESAGSAATWAPVDELQARLQAALAALRAHVETLSPA
jgi:CheY-like chemotaxis protein